MNNDKPIINIIAFQEEGGWVAQCLQYDIAAQANTFAELQREMLRAIVSHIILNTERGRAPFEGLNEAPPKFWRMYGEGEPLNVESGMPIEFTPSEPRPMPETPKINVAPKFKIAQHSDARC